ncbi:hypothetical protein [Pseudofrankia sp. DC12]|uniref:hypothetical protein n=1 Tax=Pseudofrankia sp. DC12 TaxID=683315 RepID=UPI000AF89899|nr:hypothetical protein [Pseudofrankia sp. DC12]
MVDSGVHAYPGSSPSEQGPAAGRLGTGTWASAVEPGWPEIQPATVRDGEPRPPSRRGRRIGTIVLCILGCLLCVASVSAVWLRGEVLDTNRYLKSVGPLASNPVIQDAVATEVAKAVGEEAVKQTRGHLPASIGGLVAEPIGGATEKATRQIVLSFVRSGAFKATWIAVNRTAHQQLVAALEGRPGSLLAVDNDGVLTLELNPVIVAVAHQLAGLGVAESKLRSLSVRMPISRISGIGRARAAAKWLARAAFWLPLLTVTALAGAVLTAVSRRRMLIAVGVSVTATMAVFWVILLTGRSLMVSGISDPVLARAATAAVDQVSLFLRGEIWVTGAVGLAVAGLGAALLALRPSR